MRRNPPQRRDMRSTTYPCMGGGEGGEGGWREGREETEEREGGGRRGRMEGGEGGEGGWREEREDGGRRGREHEDERGKDNSYAVFNVCNIAINVECENCKVKQNPTGVSRHTMGSVLCRGTERRQLLSCLYRLREKRRGP